MTYRNGINGRNGKLASPLSVGGQVLDEEIYSNFQGKKLHLDKGQEVEFSGIDEIESILSPDYFEYVSENKARFKGETADYSVLYDPANELLYIEKAGATYPDGLWFCGANWGHPQASWLPQAVGVWTDLTMCFIVIKVPTMFFN